MGSSLSHNKLKHKFGFPKLRDRGKPQSHTFFWVYSLLF
jgi:hypothetical protein